MGVAKLIALQLKLSEEAIKMSIVHRYYSRVVYIVFVIVVLIATSCAFATPFPKSIIIPTVKIVPMVSLTTAHTAAQLAATTPIIIAGAPLAPEQIQRITPYELRKMIEGGAYIVVVDNQPKGAYDMGHIPGAINFPWTMEIKGPVNLPRDKVLILYCACVHEEDSTDVANQLIKKFGYKKIKLLEGGWLQWVKAGYPIEKSKGK